MQSIQVPDKSPEETFDQYQNRVREVVYRWIEDARSLFDFDPRQLLLQQRNSILQLHGYACKELSQKGLVYWQALNTVKSHRGMVFLNLNDAWDFCWEDYKERTVDAINIQPPKE